MDQSSLQNWIDRVINEAQEKGFFDNLEGTGRPINWEDESLIDDEWVVAFRIMRDQGFKPEWVELHKEIEREMIAAREAVLRSWHWYQERLSGAQEARRAYLNSEWQRARASFAEAIAELNGKIADFNLMVPIPGMQKFKLVLAKELSALGINV